MTGARAETDLWCSGCFKLLGRSVWAGWAGLSRYAAGLALANDSLWKNLNNVGGRRRNRRGGHWTYGLLPNSCPSRKTLSFADSLRFSPLDTSVVWRVQQHGRVVPATSHCGQAQTVLHSLQKNSCFASSKARRSCRVWDNKPILCHVLLVHSARGEAKEE